MRRRWWRRWQRRRWGAIAKWIESSRIQVAICEFVKRSQNNRICVWINLICIKTQLIFKSNPVSMLIFGWQCAPGRARPTDGNNNNDHVDDGILVKMPLYVIDVYRGDFCNRIHGRACKTLPRAMHSDDDDDGSVEENNDNNSKPHTTMLAIHDKCTWTMPGLFSTIVIKWSISYSVVI